MSDGLLDVLDELARAGVELKHPSLRRADPLASDGQIEQRLRAWLEDLEERDLGPDLAPCELPRRRT